MIVEWLGYVLVVSTLVSAAAWLAERGAWARGWPLRWVWAGAMALSMALPVVAWMSPAPAPAATPMAAAPGAFVLESLPALHLPATAAVGLSAEASALGAWVVVSGALLSLMALLSARLWLRRRRWPVRVVEGVEVLVSERTGPAAMGVWKGRVVVPRWALDLSAEQRRLLVLHEAEHVRAGDPRLALVGLVACALAPWNLPLWWQLRRLRLAIEVDCDARVLRQTADARVYGSLLLEVGQHRAHLALALAEPRSMLERRIRMITEATTGRRTAGKTARALGLAAAAVVVLAVACETPGPVGVMSPAPASPDLAGFEDRPRSEGDCVPIIFLNGDRIDSPPPGELQTLEAVTIRMFSALPPGVEPAVDPPGYCGTVLLLTADASPEAEARARRLAEVMAARERERKEARSPEAVTPEGEEIAGEEDRRDQVALQEVRAKPTFTPMTVRPQLKNADEVTEALQEVRAKPTFTPMTARPQLKNADEVTEALQQQYPPLLRDAGIGGSVSVWFLIDRDGVVQRTRIRTPSDHEELDAAALTVAERMEFTPAYNRDERVPVWVALDIRFEP